MTGFCSLDSDWTTRIKIARFNHEDPATKETKRFLRDQKSWVSDPKVFIDTGIPIPGEPSLPKTLVHLRRDAAEQHRKELHRVGLQQIDPCWGASPDALKRMGRSRG